MFFFFQILHLIISYCRILGEMKILFKKIKRLLTCILVSATHTFMKATTSWENNLLVIKFKIVRDVSFYAKTSQLLIVHIYV
jgi:hypothetical protein